MTPDTSPSSLDPILYHAHHALRADDLPFWQRLAEEHGDSILELGCGTGRILLSFGGKTKKRTGLDIDPNMLAFLHATVPAQGLPGLNIFQSDMRSFQLSERFALAILPCNTYSTFPSDERGQIAQTVNRHLHPGGLFAFSIPNPQLLASLEPVGDFELEETFSHPQTGYPVEVFSKWERTRDRMTFFWQYDYQPPNGETTTQLAITHHHLDTPEMFLEELQRAGLIPIARFGNYQCSPFDSGESTYLIVLAQKQSS